MPWWIGPTLAVAKGLFQIIAEAVGADEKQLEELAARVPIVLAEGAGALRLAHKAAQAEDALTAAARDAAIARIRAAAKANAQDEVPSVEDH